MLFPVACRMNSFSDPSHAIPSLSLGFTNIMLPLPRLVSHVCPVINREGRSAISGELITISDNKMLAKKLNQPREQHNKIKNLQQVFTGSTVGSGGKTG